MFRRIVRTRPSPAMIVALIALFIAAAGTAYATGEGKPILGGARNPGANKSTALTKETQIIANLGGYGTRQSNKSSNGGGAIYGCRSGTGGTPAGNEPCIRANNLSTGLAFEFASNGANGGTITTSNPAASPFTTNATGVATGLNADQVDGKSASDFLGKTETAASANGVTPTKIFFNAAANTATTTIFSGGGLTLTAACSGAGALTLQVSSSKTAMLKYEYFGVGATNRFADGDGTGAGVTSGTGGAAEDDSFIASDPPRTLTGWNDSNQGSISYVANDGSTVDITLSAEQGAFGVAGSCAATGFALSA